MRSAERETRTVILTGTDPEDPRGGIGVAMAGYRAVLEQEKLLATLIPSYRPGVPGGRTWLAVRAAGLVAGAVRDLRSSGAEPVVYGHGGAAIGLLRQSLLLMLARPLGARTMLHAHSLKVQDYLESLAGRAFLRLCLAPADVVCVPSEFIRERIGHVALGKRLTVVPNPLPPDVEAAARGGERHRPADRDGRFRLLTMTRLVPGKGVDLAIRCVAELPNHVELTVAGEGTERSNCERLVAELGVGQRVHFTGWVDGEAKTRLLRASDLFLLPTRHDSFGMGLIEAMAHGLPVVALRWGAIPEVIPDGKAGILVEEPDPTALAKAVRLLLNSAERTRLGRAGRAWVLERFSAKVVGKKLRSVVDGLTSDPLTDPAREG